MGETSGRLSGTVANRYRVDRKIGEGGMATVYLAHDERHDSRVALKVLRPELASRLGGDRFVREIRITAQLQHPNILPVFDSGEADGNPFYVMPFVDGETLEQRLQREGPLPIEEAISITAEVADALAYAHERGFVHRDVKPSNIMLSHGHAQLADFGIARAIDAASDEQLTETGLAIGTAAYMSPEQGLGQVIDGRADIYSLACVLYEMLAGSPPFTGSPRIVVARHSADTAPSLRVVRTAVPEAVEQAIFRAMAKVPADRFADATQFRDALRSAVTAQMPAARPGGRSVQRTWLYRALMAAAATLLVIVGVQLFGLGPSAEALESDRVLILPLRSTVSDPAAPNGVDLATIVLNALDGAGGLRWIEGPGFNAVAQAGGPVDIDDARRHARERNAAYFVMGTLTPAGGESLSLSLTLHATGTGEVVERASERTSSDQAWRSAMVAANQLLNRLIPGTPGLDQEWLDRNTDAIASFLRGEAEFRQVHLDAAVGHYRDALDQDSTFGLAAIRGAQAATWAHRPSEAGTMIDAALRLPLTPRYAHFTAGYAAYLAGDADAAAAELRQAVEADPELAAAWMQLGEVYTHLLPQGGNPDALALEAFEEARRLDPTATNLLLHIIDIRLRRGEHQAVRPLVDQFLAADPDATLGGQVALMHACVRDGAGAIDWHAEVQERALAVLSAVKSLSAGAAQPECAIAGYRALLEVDTVSTDQGAVGRQWAALRGLFWLLVSTDRVDEAEATLDAYVARTSAGSTLILSAALVNDALAERAEALVAETRRDGPYANWQFKSRLWNVGLFLAAKGQPGEADAIADEIARRSASGRTVQDSLMVESLRAHAMLARGDTAAALAALEALVPARLPGPALTWDEVTSLGAERLALARLLFQRGEYGRVIEIADVFDSQEPLIYLLYVGPSLDLRLEAATRVVNPLLRAQYESRLDALRGTHRPVAENQPH